MASSNTKVAVMVESLRNRFWQHVDKTPGHGPKGKCWVWTASTMLSGYGKIGVNGKAKSAHRVAYELQRGPIKKGLHVCHKCDFKLCVRGSHLWLGTNLQNRQDMNRKGRNGHTRKTHCKYGHPYNTLNTHINKRGARVCRMCSKRYYKRRK